LNASKQCDFILGGVAAGGTAGFIGLWNRYHQVPWAAFSGDNTNSWNYTTGSWRSANNSAAMRTSFVIGEPEGIVEAEYAFGSTFVTAQGRAGIGHNSTTAAHRLMAVAANADNNGILYNSVPAKVNPTAGLNYLQAIEFGATTVTFYGDLGATNIQTGLYVNGMY